MVTLQHVAFVRSFLSVMLTYCLTDFLVTTCNCYWKRAVWKWTERCTLWSTLTFQRCSSRHITQVVVALMRSEISLLRNNVNNSVPEGSNGTYSPIVKENVTHGRTNEVFFAHARARRAPSQLTNQPTNKPTYLLTPW